MVASLSQCAKRWQPEPCISHQLQLWQKYEWSTVLVITPCDFVKNLDLLQQDKNRFLSTAYLDNKCKHYTRLMFLIQEMLIVMAVKDNFFYDLYSTSPQAQRIAVKVFFFIFFFSNHCQTQTKITVISKLPKRNLFKIKKIYIYKNPLKYI